MTDSENKEFSGLSSLTSNIDEVISHARETRVEGTASSSGKKTNRPSSVPTKPHPTPAPKATQRTAPKSEWRNTSPRPASGRRTFLQFLAVSGVIIALGFVAKLLEAYDPPSTYQPATTTGEPLNLNDVNLKDILGDSPAVAAPSVSHPVSRNRPNQAAELTFTKPPIGQNLIFSIAQIRWCLRESYRIENRRSDASTAAEVDRFNSRIASYNKRCSSYRYKEGSRERAIRQLQHARQRRKTEIERILASVEPKIPADSTNDDLVFDIQRLLNAAGYSAGTADGIYGSNTRAAIKAFQRDLGVTATGRPTTRIRALLLATLHTSENESSAQQTSVSNEPALSLPRSGATTRYTDDPAIASLKIRTETGSNYLVRLEVAGSDRKVLDIFIRGGDTTKVSVPLGAYTISYAAGDVWYGTEHYFGPKTRYSKTDSVFRFRQDGDRVTGYILTLYSVANGNLTTSEISAAQF